MRKLSKRTFEKEDVDKQQCQMWHCLKRIKQRLGIKLTDEQYAHIVSCIKNNKPCSLGTIKYVKAQSKRLDVYELTFTGYEPVTTIYDKFRKVIVTVYFPSDGEEICFYYDFFKNKVNVKHDLGYNKFWRMLDGELMIPNETVLHLEGDFYRVTSEGTLEGKLFKFEYGELHEVA